MVPFDLRVFLTITSLMALLMSSLVYFVSRSYPRSINGLREWTWIGVLSFLASVLYAFQGSWHHLVTTALPGMLVIVSGIFQIKGTYAHYGKTLSKPLQWSIVLCSAGLMLAWSGKEEYFLHRLVLVSGVTGVLFAAQLKLYWLKRQASFAAKFMLVTLTLLSINMFVRLFTAVTASYPSPVGIFTYTPLQAAYLAGYSFGVLLLGMGAILLASEQLRAELENLVKFDVLTGALTRRTVLEYGENELARSARLGTAFSVIMLDLDDFKLINDRHGHQVGDRVLTEFVRQVQQMLRRPAVMGRYGGEEFIVLLPDTSLAQAMQVAQRIRGNRVAVADLPSVTTSVGVASLQRDASETLDAIIGRADDALYQAKAGGRDRIEVALPHEPEQKPMP